MAPGGSDSLFDMSIPGMGVGCGDGGADRLEVLMAGSGLCIGAPWWEPPAPAGPAPLASPAPALAPRNDHDAEESTEVVDSVVRSSVALALTGGETVRPPLAVPVASGVVDPTEPMDVSSRLPSLARPLTRLGGVWQRRFEK